MNDEATDGPGPLSILPGPLRILYVEDNPLIVFHVEQMIEDLGHRFAGSFDSFASLRAQGGDLTLDGALVDIDLVDGRTGPAAAQWLHERGIPSIFLTGQAALAADYGHVSLATLIKPIDMGKLGEALQLFRCPPIGKPGLRPRRRETGFGGGVRTEA